MALCPSGQGVGLELRWALPAQVRTLSVTCVDSSVVRIPAFQAGGPGSIPGRRTISCAISLVAMIPRCQRGGPSSILGWRTFLWCCTVLRKDRVEIVVTCKKLYFRFRADNSAFMKVCVKFFTMISTRTCSSNSKKTPSRGIEPRASA